MSQPRPVASAVEPHGWTPRSIADAGFVGVSIDARYHGARAKNPKTTVDYTDAILRAYRAEKSPLLHLTPVLTSNYINVNTARPALSDVRVRRAMSLALNRDAIARQIMDQIRRNPGRRCSLILRIGIPEGLQSRSGVVIEKLVSPRWLYIEEPDSGS